MYLGVWRWITAPYTLVGIDKIIYFRNKYQNGKLCLENASMILIDYR